MATCYNRNAPEYQALISEYDSPMLVDSIINGWQVISKSTALPTLFDAEQFLKQQREFDLLEKTDLVESILFNLGPKGKGLISKLNDEWYINNTAEGAIKGDPITLENNKKKVERILDFWQVNKDAIIMEQTDKSYRIKINSSTLKVTDSIIESTDSTHALDVIQHLTRLFPNVDIRVMNETAARELYDSLPQFQEIDGIQYQKKGDFTGVKSFYANGAAILIKGRVNSETAIEEVLHPFVFSLHSDKHSLFMSLVKESRNSFPKLYQTIEATYTDTAGFNKEDRDLELVTQALSRHFKKEYEEVPTTSFRSKIKQFMKWLMDVFRDLSKYIIGKDLVIYPGMLDDTNTLSDLAKILNTSDLQFNVERAIREDRKIRFSLSDKKQKIYDKYVKGKKKGEAGTHEQVNKIEDLFPGALAETEKAIDDFSVSMSGKDNHPLTIYNKSNNTYINVETQVNIQGVGSKIMGDKISKEGIDLKNDFMSIIEDAILGQGLEIENLKVIDEKLAKDFYKKIKERLAIETKHGGKFLPQAVVSDNTSDVAGTINLLFINPDGELSIMNVEVVDYMINEKDTNNKYNKKRISVGEGSIFFKDKQKFTKKQADALKAYALARMLHNQNQPVVGTSTLYIYAPMTKKGKLKEFIIGDEVVHSNKIIGAEDVLIGKSEDNNFALSEVVKDNIDPSAVEKIHQMDKKTGTNPAELGAEEEEAARRQTGKVMALEGTIGAMTDFSVGITTQGEAIKRIKNDDVLFKSGKQMTTEIDRMVSIIELGILEGRVQPVFIELLRQSIRDMEEFIDYVVDPENYVNDPNYIGKVLNFAKMIKTYEGLGRFKNSDEVKGAAQTLMVRLLSKISEINGTRDGVGNIIIGKEGLINDAIDNFAKQFIKTTSTREFSEQDLIDVLKIGKDIGMLEYQTGTMATSRDPILPLMDRIFKRKRQEVLDRIEERNEMIRENVALLEKASGGKVKYDFMLVLDEDGLPTGRYVQRTGKIYYDERRKAAEDLRHEDGEEKVYHIEKELTEKQLKENKELYKAKKKFGKFMEAERIIDGEIKDGNFNSYTKEFKEERLKFEYFDGHTWNKRSNVDREDWLAFRAKHYKSSMYKVPIIDQNGFTGKFKEERQGWFVKDKFIKANDSAEINGKRVSLLSEKWEKLQNPTNDLERAQKNFYDMYVKYFEEDLLNKIPLRIVQQMHGKIPLIKDTTYNNLTKGPNIFVSLWSKIKAAPGAVKDYFVTTKYNTKIVLTDESGALVDTLPMFYIGNPKTEKALQAITDKINAKEEELHTPKSEVETQRIKDEIQVLKSRRSKLQDKPERSELSTDMGDSLIKFSSMAENYEVMSSIEDTLTTMIKVLDKRGYKPHDGSDIKTYREGKLEDATLKGDASLETPRIVERARKWMKMVFYDNDKQTQKFFDKVTKGLISWTSLTYVGLNPWGNLNNYAIGRLNNIIETAGGRWYDPKAGVRATRDFNERMLPDFFRRMGGKTAVNDMLGISPSDWDKQTPGSKWEALVALYRMMDQKADIRELNRETGKKETGFQRAWGWGYMLQDAAEYNVQTKVGMAILMSTKIYKSSDPEGNRTAISLYDAYNYDRSTGELKLQEGYDTIIDFQHGTHKKMSDTNTRYDLRQYIRETNIHIHGNYAYEDRMIMQTSSLGQLAAQFHKWIAPAWKARYRPEYYDENLGWLQGRYLTFWSFMTYVGKNLMNARQAAKDWKKLKGDSDISNEELDKKIEAKQAKLVKTKSPDKQYHIEKEITDLKLTKEGKDKAERYVKNIHRTTAEIGLVLMTIIMRHLFTALWDDEDEEGKNNVKRLQNAFMYQMDRQRSELLQYIWAPEIVKVMKSPISSLRMVEEMGQALMTGIQTPLVISKDKIWPGKDIELDKRIYYQRGPRKGDLKIWKETRDTMPLLYALNRWWSYDEIKNYWVK